MNALNGGESAEDTITITLPRSTLRMFFCAGDGDNRDPLALFVSECARAHLARVSKLILAASESANDLASHEAANALYYLSEQSEAASILVHAIGQAEREAEHQTEHDIDTSDNERKIA